MSGPSGVIAFSFPHLPVVPRNSMFPPDLLFGLTGAAWCRLPTAVKDRPRVALTVRLSSLFIRQQNVLLSLAGRCGVWIESEQCGWFAKNAAQPNPRHPPDPGFVFLMVIFCLFHRPLSPHLSSILPPFTTPSVCVVAFLIFLPPNVFFRLCVYPFFDTCPPKKVSLPKFLKLPDVTLQCVFSFYGKTSLQ